jgi:ParB-like chromosome segregation protein Spo0J
MRLLQRSILADGYTQPIVAWPDTENTYEVVDGFHRHRVGCEVGAVNKRVRGRLPIAVINAERTGQEDRIAATIRHNRARGRHRVEAMADIVVELSRRNWSDEKIARELGMEPDEVLRLQQVTGLADLFKNREFSQAWEAE